MVLVNLAPGNHTIEWSLSDYETITATINVGVTGIVSCISVIGGFCDDLISIVGNTVTGLLKQIVTSTFDSWIESKGGIDAIEGNLLVMGEFIDGYFGITDIGFIPTLLNMGTFIDYYFGVG